MLRENEYVLWAFRSPGPSRNTEGGEISVRKLQLDGSNIRRSKKVISGDGGVTKERSRPENVDRRRPNRNPEVLGSLTAMGGKEKP